MSYESAPATKILATHCACCGRPLVDATSVETGVGPDCRARFGYADAQDPADWQAVMTELDGFVAVAEVNPTMEPRKAANWLVYHIAADQSGPNVSAMTNAVAYLGYKTLAARIAKRLAPIQIEVQGQEYVVKSPYIENAPNWAAGVPGARWNRETKRRHVPVSSRAQLFAALKRAYPGTTAVGPKGLFNL